MIILCYILCINILITYDNIYDYTIYDKTRYMIYNITYNIQYNNIIYILYIYIYPYIHEYTQLYT